MDRPIRVALYGVGVISCFIAKALLQKKGVEIVAAVDIAADKVGRDLGEVLGLPAKLDLIVSKNVREAFSRVKPDIVIHATSSSLRQVHSQLCECIKEGVSVVSTCEELSYPYWKNRVIAEDLNRLAKDHGVSVLGTGINPGFLMDTLPITVTGPCLSVNRIRVTRVMNSGKRRIPYQKKVGTGLTKEDFREKIEKKEITGHVGLDCSIAMIADSLKWRLERIVEMPPEPVLAKTNLKTSYTTIRKGHVAGLRSIAHGFVGGEKRIELEFISHAQVEEEYDSIEIDGEPNVRLRIEGGIHGDVGTTAMIINAIPKVLNASPGLYTMNTLPIPSSTSVELSKYVQR